MSQLQALNAASFATVCNGFAFSLQGAKIPALILDNIASVFGALRETPDLLSQTARLLTAEKTLRLSQHVNVELTVPALENSLAMNMWSKFFRFTATMTLTRETDHGNLETSLNYRNNRHELYVAQSSRRVVSFDHSEIPSLTNDPVISGLLFAGRKPLTGVDNVSDAVSMASRFFEKVDDANLSYTRYGHNFGTYPLERDTYWQFQIPKPIEAALQGKETVFRINSAKAAEGYIPEQGKLEFRNHMRFAYLIWLPSAKISDVFGTDAPFNPNSSSPLVAVGQNISSDPSARQGISFDPEMGKFFERASAIDLAFSIFRREGLR